MELTTTLFVKSEGLIGIEEVSRANKDDKTHDRVSSLHHRGSVNLNQKEILRICVAQ